MLLNAINERKEYTIGVKYQEDKKIFQVHFAMTIRELKQMIAAEWNVAIDDIKFVRTGLEDHRNLVSCDIKKENVLPIFFKNSNVNQITLRVSDYKMFQFVFEPTTTILELKEKYHKKDFTLPKDQIYEFNGRVLGDDETAEECGFVNGDMINVKLIKSQNNTIKLVFYQIIDQSDKMEINTTELPYKHTMRCKELKEMIMIKFQIAEESILLFNRNKQINITDDQLEIKLSIDEEFVVFEKENKELPVFLQIEGKKSKVVINLYDKIEQLKKTLQTKEGLPLIRQELFFNEKILKDDAMVYDQGFEPFSEIIVKKKEGIHIVLTSKVRSYDFLLQSIQDWGSIVKSFEEKENLEPGSYFLYSNKKEIKDPSRFNFNRERPNVFEAKKDECFDIQINLRNINAERSFKIKSSKKISTLKNMIRQLTNIPIKTQLVLHEGVELDENANLSLIAVDNKLDLFVMTKLLV